MSEIILQNLTMGGFTAQYNPRSVFYIVQCDTCKREVVATNEPKHYGHVVFRPLDHDPHCPARNHVYLEGIGPMIEPRAMVFEKESDETTTD